MYFFFILIGHWPRDAEKAYYVIAFGTKIPQQYKAILIKYKSVNVTKCSIFFLVKKKLPGLHMNKQKRFREDLLEKRVPA